MTDRKKILFLSAWYPTRYDPMPGLFVKRHAEILVPYFQVFVLHAHAVSFLDKTYESEINTDNGVITVRVFYRNPRVGIPALIHAVKVFRFLKAHLIGFRLIRLKYSLPDLTHANILTRVGIIALLLKFRYHIPYVITEHWSRYLETRNEYKGWLRKMLTKMIVKQSSAISTVSEKLRDSMIRCGLSHKNFLVIHNVVDDDDYQSKDQISTNHLKVFSNISCFDDKAKNISGLVRAVYALSKKRCDFFCFLVGEGEDKTMVEDLAERLGIKGTFVKFTGLKEGEALKEIYNESLFTVLFSNYENMPVVIPESFAFGKPVIATSVGGIPEVINESTGLMVSAGNEKELIGAIDYMLDHHGSFDPVLIRTATVSKFGKKAVTEQLIQLYNCVFIK